VRVSLAARKSKLSSAALNVAVIDPALKLVVFASIESAPASTAASPPGGVPPDQVIEARLALTVPNFRSKSVKLRVAGGGCVECRAAGGVEELDDRLRPRIRRQHW
jgi:hypothetical protein